jgi:hypothetical protein
MASKGMLEDGCISMVEEHGHYYGKIMVRSEWTSAQDTDERPGELMSARDSFVRGIDS